MYLILSFFSLIPLFWREAGKGGLWREGGMNIVSRFYFLRFLFLFPCSGFLSQMRVWFAGFMPI